MIISYAVVDVLGYYFLWSLDMKSSFFLLSEGVQGGLKFPIPRTFQNSVYTQFTTSLRPKLIPSLRSLVGPLLCETCLFFGGKNSRLELFFHYFLSNPFFRHDKLRIYEKKNFVS